MAQFYETSVVEAPYEATTHAGTIYGVQVLSAPPKVDGKQVPYERLLEDIDVLLTVDSPAEEQLRWAVIAIADPQAEWSFETLEAQIGTTVPEGLDTWLVHEPLIALESSPLTKRSVFELAALSTTTMLVLVAGLPAVVLWGPTIGIVFIRGLAAVGGALWEGGRPEVVEFGGDATSTLLDALRRRLGIQRRSGDRR
jgi:hypothetical protein